MCEERKRCYEWVRGFVLLLGTICPFLFTPQPLEKKQMSMIFGILICWRVRQVSWYFSQDGIWRSHVAPGIVIPAKKPSCPEEGISADPVYRNGDNGHFHQTSLEGFPKKPSISDSEVICPKANLMFRVQSLGICSLSQHSLDCHLHDWCPDAVFTST